jgi:hypothetical protein
MAASGPFPREYVGFAAQIKAKLKSFLDERVESEKPLQYLNLIVGLSEALTSAPEADKVIPGIMKDVFQHTALAVQTTHIFAQLLRLIHAAFKRFQIPVAERYSSILVLSALSALDADREFQPIAKAAFRALFSVERNFRDFANKNNVWKLFSCVFFELKSLLAASFVSDLLFADIPLAFYQGFPASDFFNQFGKISAPFITFPTEMFCFAAQLFSILTETNRKLFRTLEKSNSLNVFFTLSEQIGDVDCRAGCYRVLIFSRNDDLSPGPHKQIVAHVFSICQSHPELASALFEPVLVSLERLVPSVRPVAQIVPFSSWFQFEGIKVDQFIRLLCLVSENLPQDISALTNEFFRNLQKRELSAEVLADAFAVSVRFVVDNRVTIEALLHFGFLDLFVFGRPKQVVGNLFSNQTFVQTLIEVCHEPVSLRLA